MNSAAFYNSNARAPLSLHCKKSSDLSVSSQGSPQWWANLDQAPKDLDKTIFRDLSPTPKPWVLEVLSTKAHFFGAALETIAEKSR